MVLNVHNRIFFPYGYSYLCHLQLFLENRNVQNFLLGAKLSNLFELYNFQVVFFIIMQIIIIFAPHKCRTEILVTLHPSEPAKPLHDAQMCGSLYFYTMSSRIPFQKSYTSSHDLVCLLQSRGLTVADTAKAESYLEYIGYYRLSAYIQLDNFAH